MEEHAEALAAGFRSIQRRTRAGRLQVGGGGEFGELTVGDDGLLDEEEVLRARQDGLFSPNMFESHDDAECRRLANCVRMARKRYQAEKEDAERNFEDVKRIGMDEVTEELKSALLVQNTKSFVTTLQHDDVRDVAKAFYRMEGLDENVPIPIHIDSEPLMNLQEMKRNLPYLLGIEFTELKRIQLPDMRRTSWKIDGEQEGIQFSASFVVDEESCLIEELKFDLPPFAKLEIAPMLLYCKEKSCFQTFCKYFKFYAKFYKTREELFGLLVKNFSNSCSIVEKWDESIFSNPSQVSGNAKMLSVTLRNDTKAFIAYRVDFQVGKMTTKLDFFRFLPGDVSESLKPDRKVDSLMKHYGLEQGLTKLIEVVGRN